MKIGIDISMLVYQGSGVATYTNDLVQALLKQKVANEYHLFYSSLRRPKQITKLLNEYRAAGAVVHDYHFPPRILKWLWNTNELLPVEWLIGKVDYYLSSDFLRPPLLQGTKGVTTIHDLTWKIFPEYHTPEIVSAHEQKLRRTLKHQDIILVDSESTKKDLQKYYPECKNAIHLLPLAIDLTKFRPVRTKKTKPYLLYVGAIEPRKNLVALIRGFAEFAKSPQFKDYQLVLAGRAGWKNSEVFRTVEELGLTDRVVFPGYISEEELPALYSGSALFLYLSKYEGFGLPPLEAIACGTRILTSSNSSLTEVIPKKYRMEEIENPQAIARNIKRVLKLPPPSNSLVNKYSWDKYVTEFLRILASSSLSE